MESIESKMSEALLRSGYVMESRIVRSLVQNGYFVEPNQRIADPTTGKSREIDLVAELWDSVHEQSHFKAKVTVNVYFVCEAKNNPYPIVLLTELPFSPNLETWESMHEGRTGFFKDELFDPSFFDFLTEGHKPYTQYCSFKPKKNGKNTEWLAWHPEDFHDDYHRLFVYIPVVILAGDLYLATPQNDTIALSKTGAGLHMHFGIYEGAQRLSLVLFVTEGNFLTSFDNIIRFGQKIESMVVQKVSSKEKTS